MLLIRYFLPFRVVGNLQAGKKSRHFPCPLNETIALDIPLED